MKTFEQFQVELQEIAAVRNLSRVMRAGPTFKAAIPKGVPTRNLYHGTSSNFANKIRTQGLASATGNINRIKDYNKKFYKGMSFEPGRAFVTDSGKGADAYAIMTAKAENKKLLANNLQEVKDKYDDSQYFLKMYYIFSILFV